MNKPMCTLVKSAMEVKVENVIGKEKRKDKKIKINKNTTRERTL